MPLSEHEQRLLDEMERSLYQSEGDDVTTVGASHGRATVGAIVIGILVALAGVVLLLVGVGTRLPLVGVAGFAVMFGGALFAIAPPLRFRILDPERPRAAGAHRSSFMDGLGERWDRRNEGGEG